MIHEAEGEELSPDVASTNRYMPEHFELSPRLERNAEPVATTEVLDSVGTNGHETHQLEDPLGTSTLEYAALDNEHGLPDQQEAEPLATTVNRHRNRALDPRTQGGRLAYRVVLSLTTGMALLWSGVHARGAAEAILLAGLDKDGQFYGSVQFNASIATKLDEKPDSQLFGEQFKHSVVLKVVDSLPGVASQQVRVNHIGIVQEFESKTTTNSTQVHLVNLRAEFTVGMRPALRGGAGSPRPSVDPHNFPGNSMTPWDEAESKLPVARFGTSLVS